MPEDVPGRPRRDRASSASSARPAAGAVPGNRARAGRPTAAARCARMLLQALRNTDARVAADEAGDAGIPVRGAAVAGVLPRTGGAAEAGRATPPIAQQRAADRVTLHQADAHRAAAPLLAADAGNLAAAAALHAAPAQARVPPARASALPRRLRFPRAAPALRPPSIAEDVAFWREAQTDPAGHAARAHARSRTRASRPRPVTRRGAAPAPSPASPQRRARRRRRPKRRSDRAPIRGLRRPRRQPRRRRGHARARRSGALDALPQTSVPRAVARSTARRPGA